MKPKNPGLVPGFFSTSEPVLSWFLSRLCRGLIYQTLSLRHFNGLDKSSPYSLHVILLEHFLSPLFHLPAKTLLHALGKPSCHQVGLKVSFQWSL